MTPGCVWGELFARKTREEAMAEPARLAMYADVQCLYAYVTAFRLRKVCDV